MASRIPYLPVRLTRSTFDLGRQAAALWHAMYPGIRLDAMYRDILRKELRRLTREASRRGIPLPDATPPTKRPDRRPARRYQ